MRGGDGVSDVEIRRNEIIELLFSFRKENNARRLSGMDAAMAATIALKEQTKNRMNFETGYLFCHVETKSFKLWLEALFLCLGF